MIKRWLVHYVTKHLLRAITEDDVLRKDNHGIIRARGRKLSNEMVSQLQVEAEYIQNSVTFKLLLDDMEYLAHQTMFAKSQTFDDMLFGKAMLYNIDILKKKINTLAK